MNRKLKLNELGRLSTEEFTAADKFPIVVVLDNIRSLNNIGSFFRTADALAIDKILLCGITACPPHRDIQKTALGATETVNWSYHNSTLEAIEMLALEGYKIASIEQTENSISLEQYAWKGEKVALVFGNEVDGVHQQIINQSDYTLEIPQFGTKHSFNVSVCAGIVLWHFINMKLNTK